MIVFQAICQPAHTGMYALSPCATARRKMARDATICCLRRAARFVLICPRSDLPRSAVCRPIVTITFCHARSSFCAAVTPSIFDAAHAASLRRQLNAYHARPCHHRRLRCLICRCASFYADDAYDARAAASDDAMCRKMPRECRSKELQEKACLRAVPFSLF